MNKSKEILLSPKLKREIVLTERFVARMKSGEKIPLRTMFMMENRMHALHKKIKPIVELRRLEKDIDSGLLEIARAKIRHEWILKKKKKVNAFSGVSAHRKRKI